MVKRKRTPVSRRTPPKRTRTERLFIRRRFVNVHSDGTWSPGYAEKRQRVDRGIQRIAEADILKAMSAIQSPKPDVPLAYSSVKDKPKGKRRDSPSKAASPFVHKMKVKGKPLFPEQSESPVAAKNRFPSRKPKGGPVPEVRRGFGIPFDWLSPASKKKRLEEQSKGYQESFSKAGKALLERRKREKEKFNSPREREEDIKIFKKGEGLRRSMKQKKLSGFNFSPKSPIGSAKFDPDFKLPYYKEGPDRYSYWDRRPRGAQNVETRTPRSLRPRPGPIQTVAAPLKYNKRKNEPTTRSYVSYSPVSKPKVDTVTRSKASGFAFPQSVDTSPHTPVRRTRKSGTPVLSGRPIPRTPGAPVFQRYLSRAPLKYTPGKELPERLMKGVPSSVPRSEVRAQTRVRAEAAALVRTRAEEREFNRALIAAADEAQRNHIPINSPPAPVRSYVLRRRGNGPGRGGAGRASPLPLAPDTPRVRWLNSPESNQSTPPGRSNARGEYNLGQGRHGVIPTAIRRGRRAVGQALRRTGRSVEDTVRPIASRAASVASRLRDRARSALSHASTHVVEAPRSLYRRALYNAQQFANNDDPIERAKNQSMIRSAKKIGRYVSRFYSDKAHADNAWGDYQRHYGNKEPTDNRPSE